MFFHKPKNSKKYRISYWKVSFELSFLKSTLEDGPKHPILLLLPVCKLDFGLTDRCQSFVTEMSALAFLSLYAEQTCPREKEYPHIICLIFGSSCALLDAKCQMALPHGICLIFGSSYALLDTKCKMRPNPTVFASFLGAVTPFWTQRPSQYLPHF